MADDSPANKVPDTVEMTKDVLAPAEGPRESLISTAVKFLLNPKVQQSPLHQKRAFLEKKGLTKEEIDLAVQRAGVGESGTPPTSVQPQYPPGPFSQALVPQPPAPLPSTWSRVRDFTTTAVIVSSITYAVYRIYQLYIRPWLAGQTESEERRVKRQERDTEKIERLNEAVTQMQTTLSSIHESLTAQQASLAVLSQRSLHSQGGASDSNLIQDVKSEVASLKGLLLNRRQFPPVPQTSPVLPSWQLTSSSSSTLASSDSQSNATESSPSGEAINASTNQESERLSGAGNPEFSQTSQQEDSEDPADTVEVKVQEAQSDSESSNVKVIQEPPMGQTVAAASS